MRGESGLDLGGGGGGYDENTMIVKTGWRQTNVSAIQNRTEILFGLSITSSSSQQYIIYKTYILRMHLKCNYFDKCSLRVKQI